MSRYIGPVKWLGGIAIILFILAALFANVVTGLVSEALSNAVMFRAIPFFMAFVGVLLLFILLIALVALRFNGKVPNRTYTGLEMLTIAGILLGTVSLFNPWSFVPYRYGFGLLLLSTLAFILWSHVAPPRADSGLQISPLSRSQHIAGIIAGVLVLVLLTVTAISANGPQEPYGVRQRAWDSYSEERQAEIAAEATQEFSSVEMPFLVIYNLLPGVAVYLVVRELVGRKKETMGDSADTAGLIPTRQM